MVEEACSAIVDPEIAILAVASGEAELLCATDNLADNTAHTNGTSKAVQNHLIAPLRLHFVLAEVIIAEILQPFPQFLAANGGHRIGRLLRILQNLVVNEDGAIHAQRQRV